MVTESRTLYYTENGRVYREEKCYTGMDLIEVTEKVWVRRRECNGCDGVFYCLVAVYVTFVFVFVVQYEDLTQPISVDSGSSFPVQRDLNRNSRMPTELDELSVFARIRQRPKSVLDEVIPHRMQIPSPLRRKTTESVHTS